MNRFRKLLNIVLGAVFFLLLSAHAFASSGQAEGGIVAITSLLVIQLSVILFAAWVGNLAFARMKLPAVLGEIVAGVVIGPYFLGSFGFPGFEHGLFPPSGDFPVSIELYSLATIASIILLFFVGLETDIQTFLRFSFAGSIVGVFGVIFSFFALIVLTYCFKCFASPLDEKLNEKVKFGIYSNGIRVGSGLLSHFGVVELDSKKVQKINLQVSTFSILDREMVYSVLDFSQPVKVERYVRMFGKTEEIDEHYSKDAKEVNLTKSVNGVKSEPLTLRSDESFANVLALIYKLRNDQTLAQGKVS